METVSEGQIRFALHSSREDDADDKFVDAGVFAAKLGALVHALKAADQAANGGQPAHEYTIVKLHTSTPTAILAERPIDGVILRASGIDAFNECTHAITIGETERALSYGKCASNVVRLSAGANRSFGYAEVATNDNILRVDPFLLDAAKTATNPNHRTKLEPTKAWFKGAAQGSFVGRVQVVDLRGALPALKLILSAGGKSIDCIGRGLTDDEIRAALNRRVRISGRAIYDGKSGLPRRVEIRSIDQLEEGVDFTHWRGSFEPFVPLDWEGDAH